MSRNLTHIWSRSEVMENFDKISNSSEGKPQGLLFWYSSLSLMRMGEENLQPSRSIRKGSTSICSVRRGPGIVYVKKSNTFIKRKEFPLLLKKTIISSMKRLRTFVEKEFQVSYGQKAWSLIRRLPNRIPPSLQ